jgi:hypothetical protein
MGPKHFQRRNATRPFPIQQSQAHFRRGLPSILPRKFFAAGMTYGNAWRTTPEMPAAQSFPARRRLIFLNSRLTRLSGPGRSIPDDSSTCCRSGGKKFALHENHACAAGPTQTLNPNCPAEFVVYLENAHGHSAVCDQTQGSGLRSLADENGFLLPELDNSRPVGVAAVDCRHARHALIDMHENERA